MFDRINRWRKRKEIEEEVQREYQRAVSSYEPDDSGFAESVPSPGADQEINSSLSYDEIGLEKTRMEHVYKAFGNIDKGDIYQAILDMCIAVETMIKSTLEIDEERVPLFGLINRFSKKMRRKNLGMTRQQFKSMVEQAHKVREVSGVFKHGKKERGRMFPPGTETAKQFYPMSERDARELVSFLAQCIERVYTWSDQASETKRKEVHYYHQDHIICTHCGRRNLVHRSNCEHCGAAL